MSKNESDPAKGMPDTDPNETAVLERIAAMTEPYRSMAQRLHAIIMAAAPDLKPRLWYGMPGYAKAASAPVLLFFRADEVYMTYGLTEKVKFTREEGALHQLMPCAWFFTHLDSPTEKKIGEIVKIALR